MLSSYLKLIYLFPLRPIRTDDDLFTAISIASELNSRHKLDIYEQDYFDILVQQIKLYEDSRHVIAGVSGPDALRNLINVRRVSQIEMARDTGISNTTISAIIRGRRKMGTRTIKRLATYFNVDPCIFFRK